MKAQLVFLHAQGMERSPVDEARGLLRAVESRFGHVFETMTVDAGSEPWPAEALSACRAADAVWAGELVDHAPAARRQLQWRLRRELGFAARVRPLRGTSSAPVSRALKPERNRGLDALIVSADGEVEAAEAQDAKMRDVTRVAAELAHRRWGLVTVVPSEGSDASRWEAWIRETAERSDLQSVRWETRTASEVAERMAAAPGSVDVLLTDAQVSEALAEASASPAGPGLSAYLGENGRGLYPLEAGGAAQGILSVALGLRCSLRLEREATAVEGALGAAWATGAVSWEAVSNNLIADLTASLAI